MSSWLGAFRVPNLVGLFLRKEVAPLPQSPTKDSLTPAHPAQHISNGARHDLHPTPYAPNPMLSRQQSSSSRREMSLDLCPSKDVSAVVRTPYTASSQYLNPGVLPRSRESDDVG